MNPGEQHLVIKDASFDRWSDFLHDNRLRFLDPDRVWMFEICQNLTMSEASDLYTVLKSDLVSSATVANDTSPV